MVFVPFVDDTKMAILTRTLQQNSWLISAALFVALGTLLLLSPAEATLGNVVKIVYAHGAAERVATYAYLIAGGLGVANVSLRGAQFATKHSPSVADSASPKELATLAPHISAGVTTTLARWTEAVAETAIVFWLAQFIISAPAQVLAWGAFTLSEPRVASALVVLSATALVYVVARWLGDPTWMSLAAIANAAILVIVLRGAINILHPVDPIIGSDSPAIKVFYAAIVVVMGLLALQFARDRAAVETASTTAQSRPSSASG